MAAAAMVGCPISPPRGAPRARGGRRGGSGGAARDRAGQPAGMAAVVSTPWYPDGLPKRDVSLATEAAAFAALAQLTNQERESRERLAARIGEALGVGTVQGTAATLVGPFALGIATADTAVDLCVEGVPAAGLSAAALRLALEPLTRAGCELRALSAGGGTAAFELAERDQQSGGQQEVVVTVTVHPGSGASAAGRRTTEALSLSLKACPSIAAAYAVLRRVLSQGGNSGSQGGLSCSALVAMLAAVYRRTHDAAPGAPAPDAGAQITAFCQLFSESFDPSRQVVDASGPGGMAPRCPAQWPASQQLVVVDPADAARNLALGCRRLAAVTASLRSCSFMLARWSTPRRRGCYKGRTPLSGLISYRDLWYRARVAGGSARSSTCDEGLTDEHISEPDGGEAASDRTSVAQADEEEDAPPPLIEEEEDSGPAQ
eukprot:TRINITY_DN5173_c0_g3_i2.p1 TRINITY_DN5173_c0_g3~~TRINITY_DN5173_c0_g3_i2.p1  ORF type:complete len:462 (+),score=126.14 TRINITY_DN5173_c0_g3_i2:91-1386(+)